MKSLTIEYILQRASIGLQLLKSSRPVPVNDIAPSLLLGQCNRQSL